MIMNLRRFGLLALLFISTPSLPAGAAQKTVVVEGESAISREDARRQALRSAVEQGAGVFIHSQTEVESFELKKDKILSRTEGYVTRYTLLDARKQGGVHRVRLRAVVSLDKIKDDLIAMQILMAALDLPLVMVIVEEEYIGMESPGTRYAEAQLVGALKQRGFELVDQAQLQDANLRAMARLAFQGGTAPDKQWAMGSGAQYIVLGQAVVEDKGEAVAGVALRSIQATLRLKVVQTQTGAVLGSAVRDRAAAHISSGRGASRALQMTVDDLVDAYLVDRITCSFQDYLNNGAPLILYATGVKTFRQYKLVAETLEDLELVVTSRKGQWKKSTGLLVMNLRVKGTSEEVAELLDSRQVGDHTLEVVDFEPDRLDLKLR